MAEVLNCLFPKDKAGSLLAKFETETETEEFVSRILLSELKEHR